MAVLLIGTVLVIYGWSSTYTASVAPQIIDSYTDWGWGWQQLDRTHPSNTTGRYSAISQCFYSNAEFKVTSCQFKMNRNNTDITGSLIARIYAMTGTFGINGLPTGSPLVSSQSLDFATLPVGIGNANMAFITFTFASSPTLAAGQYCVTVEVQAPSNINAASNVLRLATTYGSQNPTHPGNYARFDLEGWEIPAYVTDAIFYVYGTITVSVPFKATLNPASATVNPNVPQTFTVTVSGATGPFTYRWYEGSNIIAGETNVSFTVTKSVAGTYQYSVTVTDSGGAGTISSNVAILTVATVTTPPPGNVTLVISTSTGGTTNPATGSYQYSIGSTVTVTATANSGYSFTKWIVNGIDQPSVASSITLTLSVDTTLQAMFTATSTRPTPPISIDLVGVGIILIVGVVAVGAVSRRKTTGN